ncbi:F-actin-capping protein subunit beta [Neofusicoccum ribis]|uniref:F-actin-capping protein subunit beta n=1 Tax=Neofusicoccum ribis TaxID=45134 RepID=A0ABR3SDT4_9PEZI
MIMTTPKDGKPTVYHAIMKAYLLLGRVNEHVHSLEASSDPDEHYREFRQLDTELSRFKLSLPRHATTLRTCPVEEAKQIVWLNAILSTATILLHHRPVTSEDELPQSPSTEGSTASQPDTNASFEYCVSAARNMARLIQEATRISVDTLINPHIGSSLYVCGKILILHTHLTKSDEVRTDIDMFLLLCDRIADVYPTLGTKFKNGMRYDLKQDAKGVRKMREDGARGMMTKCGDWAGANPQATLEKLTAAFGR